MLDELLDPKLPCSQQLSQQKMPHRVGFAQDLVPDSADPVVDNLP
jgi:hypothetical protein